jgi:hypothetical protein
MTLRQPRGGGCLERDACKDRCKVCTRKWRAAQLDDSGRQGSMPVQCRGASVMTLSRQTFSSGFQGLPALSPLDVWTGILTSTTLGHDCFERRGEIPAILESALSHTLASETTALLNPKSESGSISCTLVKSAKTSSVVRPADLPGPGPAPSAWKPLAELRICPRILQANRVAHASHSCASLSRLCSTHLHNCLAVRETTLAHLPLAAQVPRRDLSKGLCIFCTFPNIVAPEGTHRHDKSAIIPSRIAEEIARSHILAIGRHMEDHRASSAHR